MIKEWNCPAQRREDLERLIYIYIKLGRAHTVVSKGNVLSNQSFHDFLYFLKNEVFIQVAAWIFLIQSTIARIKHPNEGKYWHME